VQVAIEYTSLNIARSDVSVAGEFAFVRILRRLDMTPTE